MERTIGMNTLTRITNLRLRAIIGTNQWERNAPQDVTVNVEFEFDGSKPARTDDLNDVIDYKALTKRISNFVEGSQFFLLEKLSASILELVMQEPRVQRASVTVDKPGALRFADSVSVTCRATRGE